MTSRLLLLSMLIMSMLIMSMLIGCSTYKGGMPVIPFSVEEDLGVAQDNLKEFSSVKKYYDSPSKDARNKFIASRLLTINIGYLQYIKSLAAEEAQIHSAADILVLSLDIASTAFIPSTTKTALSAFSSAVGGARLSIDKNAYYEKAVPALISSMNAQRKEVLARILRGTAMDLNGYPFETAVLSDLNEYYQAGTIQGALSAIQRDAGAKETKTDGEIKDILKKRDASFVANTVQERVSKLLDEVAKLDDKGLFDLIKSPPTTEKFIDDVVAARDPGNKRISDRATALMILKMRIALSERDEKSLAAWEAAIKSVSKPGQ